MSAFRLPTFTKPRDFSVVRMRISLVAWLLMGLFFILIIAPRLLGIS